MINKIKYEVLVDIVQDLIQRDKHISNDCFMYV